MQNNYNENTGTAFPVFSILNFNGRAYDHRLVTDYLSPSNHLLMQWQTTPAATAIIKESIKNILLN